MSISLLFFIISCGNNNKDYSENNDNLQMDNNNNLLSEEKKINNNPYSSVTKGDIIEFGGFDWRVLDVQDGKALILSEYILFTKAYHSSNQEITWEQCDLREYLNGEFYDNTFSAEEKAYIIESAIVNNDDEWYDTDGGSDTTDNVFLLSTEEVVEYFGDSGQFTDRPDDKIDDEYNEARRAFTKNGEMQWWWLRSPGGKNNEAAIIAGFGMVGLTGFYVGRDTGGVRPAFWLNTES